MSVGNTFPLSPYVPTQSVAASRTETTIFDQVYGNYRRRPAMVSLNVQWVPVGDRSGAYQWSGGDCSGRKVKTVTFFGTGEMRGQQGAKAVTPPSSDYTDAYLSTFAAKPIPARHIHRLSTSVFANSAPIPLKPTSMPIFTSSSTKTTPTPFNTMSSSSHASATFDQPTLSSSYTRNAADSSSFAPERPAAYQPFSSTQYSSPQSQTFTTSYSTLLRSPTSTYTSSSSPSVDTQRSYTTFPARSQPSTSTFPTFNRSETSYDSIYKPLAPYSVQSYPPSNVTVPPSPSTSAAASYSSYKPVESISSDTVQRDTTDRVILPSSKVEKPIGRPETLLFQHDEDLRSSRITKPSPIFNPSPETPTLREKPSVEPEPTRLDDLITASSAPIQILENTLNKYDSLINQISEVLASVSPLSSTISSMSPGKSVLDYQLSSDDSPIVPYKRMESQLPQQSTPVKSHGSSQAKSSHLIREDSYDKIATAISDLDTVMISPSDTHKSPPSMTEEAKTSTVDETHSHLQSKQEEEVNLASTMENDTNETALTSTETQSSPATIQEEETTSSLVHEDQVPSPVDEQKTEVVQDAAISKETRTSFADEQVTSSSTLEEDEATKTSLLEGEHAEAETKVISANEQAASLASEGERMEETKTPSSDDQQTQPMGQVDSTTAEKDVEQQFSSTEQLHDAALTEQETKSSDKQQVPTVSPDDTIEDAKITSTDDHSSSSPSPAELTASLEETKELPSSTEKQDEQQTPPVSQEQSQELPTIAGEEQQVSESVEMEKEEAHIENKPEDEASPTVVSVEQQQTSVSSPSDISTPQALPIGDEKLRDGQPTADESVQQQTTLSSSESERASEVNQEEQSSTDDASGRKSAKHVTWDETVVDNEDDVESLSQSLTDESSHSESSTTATTTTEDYNATADESTAAIDQFVVSPDTTELSTNADQKIEPQSSVAVDSAALQTVSADQQSLTVADEVTPMFTSESRKDTTTDEQIAENVSVKEVTTVSPSTIVSPVDALADTVANRYISSDVYHGYLGDHKGFLLDNASDVNSDSGTKSLLNSLRETIATPMTPLIETIQSVVSSMQTTTATSPLNTEVIDRAQAEQNEPTPDTSEQSKTIFESLRDAVAVPISAVAETIQIAVSNLQSDKHEITPTLAEETPVADEELSLKTIRSSNEQINNQPDTMPAVTNTLHDVVPSEISSTDVRSDNEPSVLARVVDEESAAHRAEPDTSLITDTTVSTSSDDTGTSVEQQEPQDTKKVELSLSPASEPTSNADKTEALPIGRSEEVDTTEYSFADTSLISSSPEDKTIETSGSSPDLERADQVFSPIATSSEPTDTENKQDTSFSEISESTSTDQSSEDKESGTRLSSAIAEHAVMPTDVQSETATIENTNGVTGEQTVGDDTSAETKTTLDTIRDVITHPFATLSEKIQSMMPTSTSDLTEEAASAAMTEKSEERTANAITEDRTEVTETKTTLETIREVIAHPIATITEKLHNVLSSSDNDHIDHGSSVVNAVEHAQSSEEGLLLTTPSATTVEDQSDSVAKTERSVSIEPKSTLDTLRDVLTHPFATITEKIQSVISSSTANEAAISEQQIPISTTDQDKDQIVATVPTESTSEIDQGTVTNPSGSVDEEAGQNIVTNVSNQISPSEDQVTASEASRVYSQDPFRDTQTAKTTTDSSSDSVSSESDESISDANQILLGTIRDLINETISSVIRNLDQTAQEVLAPVDHFSASEMTWSDLVDPGQHLVSSSDPILDERTGDKTATAPSDQSQSGPIIEDGTEQPVMVPQTDDMMQRSSNATHLDSMPVATETQRSPSTDIHEPSPANTEDDPSELIHALQGHSILVPSSSPVRTHSVDHQSSLFSSVAEKSEEQLPPTADRSSSSATTSSQITSSDRYVSYAIHEMGDSSQERLPSFPVAADIPVYQSEKKTSDESKEHRGLSEPIGYNQPGAVKDEDLTELDATENLTSYSDDVHVQRQTNLQSNQQQQLDASSTDEDVDDENFNELEAADISNLYRIVDEITRPGAYEHTYQRYDLSTSSSVSTKPQTDDVYMIPGYPGLWKPSADDDDSSHSGFANDADDEDEKNHSASAMKTKITTRTTNPDASSDIFNRPLNEFSFDVSESDSFKTCASTINSSSASKQAKPADLHQVPISELHEHQISPDERIILIRERERGVSLPVTMKIDYDDMALRLSSSTPIDTSMYSSAQTDPPSPSTSREPLQKTTSSSEASTPSLSSNESEQQKLPSASSSSWLNTINTITTTTEGPDGPLEARTTIHKSARGPISIAECEPQGKYVLLENTSRSKSIALAGWTLHQENDNGDVLTFTFPDNCLLRSNQSLKILSRSNETERRNSDLIASLLSSWHTGSNVVTKLINAEGKDRASLTKKTLFS